MRRYRAVSLGMPITRPAAPLRRSDPITTRPAAASKRSEAMRKGRQADSARRHQRVITTLERASNDGAEISVSAIHALQAAPAASGQARGRASPAPPCKPAWPPNTSARSGSPAASGPNTACLKRSASRPARAQHPAYPGRLAQEHGQLQQQVIDLRLQLEERDQDLATVRPANRKLMAQLNHALRRS